MCNDFCSNGTVEPPSKSAPGGLITVPFSVNIHEKSHSRSLREGAPGSTPHRIWKRRTSPHPALSALVIKQPVLLRSDFVLTKGPSFPTRPFPVYFYHKMALRKANLDPNRPLVKRVIFLVRPKMWGWGPFLLFQLISGPKKP